MGARTASSRSSRTASTQSGSVVSLGNPSSDTTNDYVLSGSGATSSVTFEQLLAGSNTATSVASVYSDPVATITTFTYTNSAFANIADAVATTANTTGNIRIFGTNFVAGSTVYLAGNVLPYANVVSNTEIQARIPALTAGTYDKLMIFSPTGFGILSNLSILTVNAPLFTTASVLSFAANTAFSTSIDAIGIKATNGYRISDGSLPANVSFNTTTGALSGNIRVNSYAATWNFDVTANTEAGITTVQNHYLVITGGNIDVTYLVVGGGGGGGGTRISGPSSVTNGVAGSGGAGGYLTGNTKMDTTQTYTVTVGGGSTVGPFFGGNSGSGSSLVSTWPGFSPIVTAGGGGGGDAGFVDSGFPSLAGYPGQPGGSGGGGGQGYTPAPVGPANGSAGSGIPGQGNPGATPGPGGAKGGGAGPNSTGLPNTITGANLVYAIGGAPPTASVTPVPNAAGYGGGGAGGRAPSPFTFGSGSRGAPGIVIIRYSSLDQIGSGGQSVTNYTSGNNRYWVHQFTSPTLSTSTFLVGSAAGIPVWANANLTFYANYYNAAISTTQLRAYNAVSYAVATGNTLPTGLSLTTGGVLSGTATSERASFYINATSSTSLVSSQEFSLVYTYPTPVWVTSATLPSGNTIVAYSQQLSATVPAGLGSVTYSVSTGNTLPTGLSLSSSGLLSGLATVANTYTFYIRAAHNIGSAFYSEQQFSVTIFAPYTVTYLAVAGGGGSAPNGGGGGGGVLAYTVQVAAPAILTVAVGGGGPSNFPNSGSSPMGGDSYITGGTVGNIVAVGGGCGEAFSPGPAFTMPASPGGSGGGSGAIYTPTSTRVGEGYGYPSPAPTFYTPTGAQGYPGRYGPEGRAGGGAGGSLPPKTATPSGGGPGYYWPLNGVIYASGGNGGVIAGGPGTGINGDPGSGGGGSSGPGQAFGGSGVVILSIPTPRYPGSAPGATLSTPPAAPGMTVLTYTTSGTYTA